jgi:hypothetical protein
LIAWTTARSGSGHRVEIRSASPAAPRAYGIEIVDVELLDLSLPSRTEYSSAA